MRAAGYRLGVDFGTSHTVAILRWPDGRARPLLFGGSPLLPSAVYADDGGRLVVGRDALDSARLRPSRLEPNPKRCVDDGTVLLGDREVRVEDLIAAVLGTVAEEARRTAGDIPPVVTLTCPAAWGTPRRRVLLAAAARAGLGQVRLVEEPVAAATYFAHGLGQDMAVGSAVLVYDFGGGTFDASLVERTSSGFRILAVAGRADIGGLDLDEALIRRLGEVYGPTHPDAWRRLAQPASRHERRERNLFREDVRAAKERLSRQPSVELSIPGVDRDVHVTREEFEQLALPYLAETVRLAAAVAGHEGFPRRRIAGVFLVGGASRIPLVATLVHRGTGIAPTLLEQPELVVAEGSIALHSTVTIAGTSPVPAAPPIPDAPATTPGPREHAGPFPPAWAGPQPAGDPPPAQPRPAPAERRTRRLVAAAAATVVLAVVAVTAYLLWPDDVRDPVPAACLLASRADGTVQLDRGEPAPVSSVTIPDNWRWHADPSGFRIAFPAELQALDAGTEGQVCFGDTGADHYLGVAQWRQPDTDLVTYWVRKEEQVRSRLPGYQRVGEITAEPNYFAGSAEWEFTFDDGGTRLHGRAVALVTRGGRGYGYFLVTRDSTWASGLQEFTVVKGSFRPAG